jgi:predicted dehydrogenase
MKGTRALVVGYGSIGRRHAKILQQMGMEVGVLSQYASNLSIPTFTGLRSALDQFRPDYVVVANPTAQHSVTLKALNVMGFDGRCLVEKPLLASVEDLLVEPSFALFVGYVLRFHPVLQRVQKILEGCALYSITSYVGQYLPDWRPGTDYRKCYSAQAKAGGGVLRDLSHELDYLRLLAGNWKRLTALGGRFGKLEISSDDVFDLLWEAERCPSVSCHMNYLDRNPRRDCSIHYEGGSLFLDLMGATLWQNGTRTDFEIERNDMFRSMHQAVLSGERDRLPCWEDGVSVMRMIDASSESVQRKEWIWNKRD